MEKTKPNSKKLVVVADDFGWCESVNQGIVKAAEGGIVTEISLMLNSPGTEGALNLIKSRGLKNVGIHLLLFNWNKTGKRFRRNEYKELFRQKSAEEIREIALDELHQFEQVVGKKPTHVCPQYNIHGNLRLLQTLIEYAKEDNIPVRIPRTLLTKDELIDQNYAAEIMLKRNGIRMPNHLFGHILGSSLDVIKSEFLKELKTVKDNETAEILVHPGYFDKELLLSSTLNYERARDLSLCTDADFKKDILDLGFEFTDYSNI